MISLFGWLFTQIWHTHASFRKPAIIIPIKNASQFTDWHFMYLLKALLTIDRQPYSHSNINEKEIILNNS